MRGVPGARLPAAYAASGRRALRVTLVAGGCFYLFRYGFDRPVAAIYALFTVVALGGLSRIPGTGRQQAAVILRLLPVCWVLVTVGTYLSVRTWTAAVGMLVVGFTLAFSAVGGPRLAGAAPGLQLLYILPSFPPYDPGSLGDRLIGTTTGAVLFVAAEALLFREPAPLPYRERAARTALNAEHCATRLAAPPYALTDTDVRAARAAGQALRPLNVPEAERPAGPGVRDRALTHTGLAIRTLLSRLAQLPAGPGAGPAARQETAPDATAGPVREAELGVTAVLRAVAALAAATAACLRAGDSPSAEQEALAAARERLSEASAGTAATRAHGSLPPGGDHVCARPAARRPATPRGRAGDRRRGAGDGRGGRSGGARPARHGGAAGGPLLVRQEPGPRPVVAPDARPRRAQVGVLPERGAHGPGPDRGQARGRGGHPAARVLGHAGDPHPHPHHAGRDVEHHPSGARRHACRGPGERRNTDPGGFRHRRLRRPAAAADAVRLHRGTGQGHGLGTGTVHRDRGTGLRAAGAADVAAGGGQDPRRAGRQCDRRRLRRAGLASGRP
ncbi:hypothetical protein GCM10017687_00770 [Streptomyces echinatus]